MTGSRISTGMVIRRLIAISVAAGMFLLLASMPVSADTLYISGGPDMSAAIAGTNEFSPGSETTIRVTVENRGLIDMKIIRSDIVGRDDLPNKAKMVRVSLLSGTSPIIVKTDPQMIGDIAGGSSSTVTFNVLIPKDAAAGRYVMPLEMEYTYLYSAESEGTDNIRYYYKTVKKTLNLNVNIKSVARLEVLEIETEHLNVGTEGYLILKLQNGGSEHAGKSVLLVSRHGSSPVIPVESSVYIGDLSPGEVMERRIKVSIASTAEGGQHYPLDMMLRYENREGIVTSSDQITIGVPVAGKVEFEIVSPPASMFVGEKKVLELEFRNTGAAPVYSALARISAVDPFTSSDDTSYLGDMAPGESRIARFEVKVDSDATPKWYGLDTEIRYRDALDNTLVSDPMKARIEVKEREGMLAIFSNSIFVSLLIVAIIAVVYLVLRVRRTG